MNPINSEAAAELKPFTCWECGSKIKPMVKSGRTVRLFRDVDVPVPDNWLLLHCENVNCDEEYSCPELNDPLYRMLDSLYLKSKA